jgi:hypothetical protein
MSLIVNVSFPAGKKKVYDALYAAVTSGGDKVSTLVVGILEAHFFGGGHDNEIVERLARIERLLKDRPIIAMAQTTPVASDQEDLQAQALEALAL